MRGGRRGGRIAAPHANECPRCGEDMKHTSDMVRTRGGRWIHRWCAGGGDDE